MPHPTAKPRLAPALRFRCPYCAETPLRTGWFVFAHGCRTCDYTFERELGYFTGASWMIAFPTVSIAGFAMAALLLIFAKGLDWMLVVGMTSVSMIAFGAWFAPYSMAFWLWLEHRLHPLNPDDKFQPQETAETT